LRKKQEEIRWPVQLDAGLHSRAPNAFTEPSRNDVHSFHTTKNFIKWWRSTPSKIRVTC